MQMRYMWSWAEKDGEYSHFSPRIPYHIFSDSESDILPKIFPIFCVSLLKSNQVTGVFLGISTELSRFSNQ